MHFQKKHIPNLLSILRLAMIPIFVYVFFMEKHPRFLSLTIFLLAEITDVIDGYLARKYNWVTEMGKILDPMADKLMQATVLVSLSVVDRIFIWLAGLYFAKELLIVTGAIIMTKTEKPVVPPAQWYGKLGSFMFAALVTVFIVYPVNRTLNVILTIVLACTLMFSLLMYYFKVYRKYLTRSK